MQAFVERLEQAAAEEDEEPGSLPSGETIANDLQNFLRQRGGDGEGGAGSVRPPAGPTSRSEIGTAGPQRSAAGQTSR